jgi:FtsZ-interacting cell division protein ZipA
MDTLRWILLIFGIVLITGIYFVGRRRESQFTQRREPVLDDRNPPPVVTARLDPVWGEQADAEPEFDTESPDQYEVVDFEQLLAESSDIDDSDAFDSAADIPVQQKPATNKQGFSMLLEGELVVIHLLAQDDQLTSGETLYPLAYELGFELGNDGIFHYRLAGYPFLLVNMFKPGTFPDAAELFESRGVSLVLPLSKVRQPIEAFGDLMSIAYELKSLLNAQLLDVRRTTLTNQSIAFLEEEIRQYHTRQRA